MESNVCSFKPSCLPLFVVAITSDLNHQQGVDHFVVEG